MSRALLAALLALMLAVAAAPSIVRAEVIDYNPADDVPQILSPDEMALYDRLRTATVPAIQSDPSPNGQYLFVAGVGLPGVVVLDVDTGQFETFPVAAWDPSMILRYSPYLWVGPTTAVVLTCNRRPSEPQTCDLAKTVVDAAAKTLQTHLFEPAPMEGKQVRPLLGMGLLAGSGGKVYMPAYTLQAGASLERVEQPDYDIQTPSALDDRQRLGLDTPERLALTTDEQLLVISLEDGAISVLGDLPAGSSLTTAVNSLAVRPGTDTFSYVVTPEITCSGTQVRGRSCRGGGMPTSNWLVLEDLGRVPPAENRYLTETSLFLADLATGQRRVIQNGDYAPGQFASTLWTADGSLLLVVALTPSVLDGRPYPIYGSPSGQEVRLFQPDGTFLGDWSPPVAESLGASMESIGGTRLLVMTPANTNRAVYIVDAALPEAPPTPVFTGAGTLYSWGLAGAAFVYVLGDVTVPGEMYLAETADVAGTSRAITDLNAALRQASKIKSQPIRYTTSAGYEVEGVYVYPADWPFPPPEPQPVVVWQQGGPGGQVYNLWGVSVEGPYSLLPNYGIPVFLVNGSGRFSNGAQFYSDMAEGANFGQRDILDVKEGVERLIAMGVVDPDAVGITGCSYGGYFTLQSLVEWPDFYAAANTQCTLNDLAWEYNFGWAQTIGYLMGRTPAGDAEEYFRDSPFYRSGAIRTPLLVFHGTNDFLPFEHMTNVHDQVAEDGVPARFLRVLGEGHGFSYASSQRYAMQLQIDWFRRYLTHQATTAAYSGGPAWLELPGLRQFEVGR